MAELTQSSHCLSMYHYRTRLLNCVKKRPLVCVTMIIASMTLCLSFTLRSFTNCQLGDCYRDIDLSKEDDEKVIKDVNTFSHIRFRDSILLPPSRLPYNLENNDFEGFHESVKFYKKHLESIFEETKNGFFVEAGALDGEYMSNTLWLEVKLGWTGLLVEPDPISYSRLQKKNRKAWTAQSCFSVKKYPREEVLSYSESKEEIKVGNETRIVLMKGNSYVKGAADSRVLLEKQGTERSYNLTCYPMADFLMALNVTTVDLLSLDIETIEEEIIKNFDFSLFDIQVIFIEWLYTDTASWLMSFMESRGYTLVGNTPSDFVFVKRGSKYEHIARRKNLFQPFRHFV